MDRTEFQFRLINTILTALLLLGVASAWLAFRADQDQRRRAYTMHLYDEWRALLDVGEARATLELVRTNNIDSADLLKGQEPYDIIAQPRRVPCAEKVPEMREPSSGDSVRVVCYEPRNFDYDQVLKMRQHIISVLNLFEQIAVAEQYHVGDANMIKSLFSAAIVDHYRNLAPFMAAWTDVMQRAPAWLPLGDAVERWMALPPPPPRL